MKICMFATDLAVSHMPPKFLGYFVIFCALRSDAPNKILWLAVHIAQICNMFLTYYNLVFHL